MIMNVVHDNQIENGCSGPSWFRGPVQGSRESIDHSDRVAESSGEPFMFRKVLDYQTDRGVSGLHGSKCSSQPGPGSDHDIYICIAPPYDRYVSMHRNCAKNGQNSQKFLISWKDLLEDKFSLYCSSLSSVQRIEEVQKLDCPYNGPGFLSVIQKYRFSDDVVLLCYRNRGLRTVLRTSKPPLETHPQSDFSHTGKKVVKHLEKIKQMDLQEEIIMDILSRLPVQSLLRSKCVSKFWMTLISQPYFTTKHFNHAKHNQSFEKMLLLNKEYPFHCSSLSSDQLFEDGLGYDLTSDDYKIFKIDGKERNEILALKSGSWRKIDDHPATDNPVLSDMDYLAFQHGALDCVDTPSNMGYLAFVHGAFHWIDLLLNKFVVTFSISDEVNREIPLPEGLDLVFDIMHSKQGVSVLGGMLCVYSTRIHHWEYTFKLWVMNEYGVKESWNQLFTIQSTDLYSITLKYMFSDGEVLLRCS
ncbi:hypothetical protein CQW23_31136 [Capsicum baccatum]|uniref:F-box domain-containing protein n=1 Tax=Capsicum baccatum TaxID=33114 RepID=A0A2G2V8F2_CAPBA|nr:hypothetical protein CQW23_31136 [Capsicum baccatum]